MGTWNVGNFDNDEALDYVCELMEQLQARVDQWFAVDEPDIGDGGEGVVMPTVAIMHLLAENCNAAPPKQNQVSKWSERYVELYGAQIDELSEDEEFKKQRKLAIQVTFKKLEESSRAYWSGEAKESALVGAAVKSAASSSSTSSSSSASSSSADAFSQAVKSSAPSSSKSSTSSSSSSHSTGPYRRFEFVDDKSSKFWQISLDGTAFTVVYGRIGTEGQAKTKDMGSESKAKSE
ncbi:MAG: WGR domain-containing protein, partial [Cyanobacteria bacterium]|nr:WGR domain-containing protein [Cyanobacteriota bacterium]